MLLTKTNLKHFKRSFRELKINPKTFSDVKISQKNPMFKNFEELKNKISEISGHDHFTGWQIFLENV